MKNKRQTWVALLLFAGSVSLFGAAGRPEDGLLFFLVILGLLGAILGIIHLVEILTSRFRKFLNGMLEGLLP